MNGREMTNGRLWFGLALQAAGFGIREYGHVLARRSIIDYVTLQAASRKPGGAPACVYDCSHRFSDAAFLFGWLGLSLIVIGTALIIASIRKKTS